MSHLTSGNLTAGFLPLVDAALFIAAREKGFAQREGISLTLVRETSWANIRDRIAIGHFHCAHMLAPMPIAARLGLTPMPVDLIAPMALGFGGNTVTVSKMLLETSGVMEGLNGLDALAAGRALARMIAERRSKGKPKLSLAVVHPYSAHNYELRYWLHASGIDPDSDLEIVIVPPPFLPDALANGRIDGFCAGEPWGSVAVRSGSGIIMTGKSAIWRSSPEKVLGVEASFAEKEPELIDAIIRALYAAAEWCGAKENQQELAALLAQPDYIGVEPDALLPALKGHIDTGYGDEAIEPDFYVPFARAATFPWKSHAVWFYSQMVRWGQLTWHMNDAQKAADVYRPDIYRRALALLGVPFPSADAKVEGSITESRQVSATKGELTLGPDGFFDGRIFDPEALELYLESQSLSASS